MAEVHYPDLIDAALDYGLSYNEAVHADAELYMINEHYYQERDDPPMIETFGGEYMEMPEGQIEDAHYLDFYDWWVDHFGAETWDERHEIYG